MPSKPARATSARTSQLDHPSLDATSHEFGDLVADVDLGGRAVVGEEVAALPLRGDVGVGHRLQPGAQDRFAEVLGVAELGLAFA